MVPLIFPKSPTLELSKVVHTKCWFKLFLWCIWCLGNVTLVKSVYCLLCTPTTKCMGLQNNKSILYVTILDQAMWTLSDILSWFFLANICTWTWCWYYYYYGIGWYLYFYMHIYTMILAYKYICSMGSPPWQIDIQIPKMMIKS
jgi:hypothetical protein